MKNWKKVLTGCAMVMALSSTCVTAFAATYQSPAQAAAGITGKTLEDVAADALTGKTYGTIAAENGKLAEFQQAMLAMRQSALNDLIATGAITQEQAAALLSNMATMQSACGGTGLGMGAGCGMGYGNGMGYGAGRGMGRGMGLRNGSCLYR